MVEHTRTPCFWVAFVLGLGTMFAAGIFSLSGAAVAEIRSSVVIAALIAGITAASHFEFASIYAENGGSLFSSRTFERDKLEYAVGAALFLGYTGTTAFYLATIDEWFFGFIVPSWLSIHRDYRCVRSAPAWLAHRLQDEKSATFQLLAGSAKDTVMFAFLDEGFLCVCEYV